MPPPMVPGQEAGAKKQAFAFFVWSPEKKQNYGTHAHLGVTLTLRGESHEKLVQATGGQPWLRGPQAGIGEHEES